MQNKTWTFWGMLSLLFLIAIRFHDASGQTDPVDATALQAILTEWTKAPPSWEDTTDPCGRPWQGIICEDSRVTRLQLTSMGIEGSLSSDIGSLTELTSIELSYNPKLVGPLPGGIVNLKKLTTLRLVGCSFNGPLPKDLGNLKVLRFLDLNTNGFIGSIPDSVGNLSEIYWLDLAHNHLVGTLPVTLGQLSKALHFHLNQNKLSGTIPAEIFHENMKLIHVLLDSNNLTGKIPETLGLVTSLEALRLDRNHLTGPIPSNISNLTKLIEMNLGYNKLSGRIPDLSEMRNLRSLDLSNNSFDPSDTPNWFTHMESLNTLALENGNIQGELPTAFFDLPQLEEVRLSNNKFNGTLDITGSSISKSLKLVDLEDNDISSSVSLGTLDIMTLSLAGNPVCNSNPQAKYCVPAKSSPSYNTSLSKCSGRQNCNLQSGEETNPKTCTCYVPYKGTMVFRAPSFTYLGDSELFQSLEKNLWMELGLQPNYVYLSDIKFNTTMDYLNVGVSLFNTGVHFNRSQIQTIGFRLSNQTFKPPDLFGTFYFIADPYSFPDTLGGKSELSSGALDGIVIACAVLFIGILILGIYAFNQKKRAERATLQNTPFASWAPLSEGTGAAPQLKGARWFSFAEVEKYTNRFSGSNEIGGGGYGKVYRGTLPSGQVVAIKRSQKGSSQGELEFKTEIELLSRLHHRNLVGFAGFCFDQGEQMLVYEFVSHGNLRENLSGKTNTPLDWKRRLKIALDSARGLSYLHDHADPPIIHRDIKSANILLDENLTAKVADFGLSKIMSDAEKTYVSTQVKGTLGYLDPEYYMSQQLTDKSDVYSFGVVMLELVTSKLPIEKGRYIVREMRQLRQAMREKGKGDYGLRDIMDPIIRNANLINLKRFVDLAMQCVEEEAINRPRMNEIVKEIESILQNEGSNPTSASSSQTEEFSSLPQRHSRNPYSDQLPLKDISSDSFLNTTGYTFSDKIQPM